MARKTKTSSLSIEEKLEQALIVPGYEPYKIPDNWCWTTIGAVANIYRGVSYKKNEGHSEKYMDDVLIMRGGNIQEGCIEVDADNVYIKKELVSDTQIIKKYDVIIVSSTGSKKVIGRAGISFHDYADVAFGAFLTLVRPYDDVCKPYISYYFQSDIYRNRVRMLASGVNINNIRNEYITETPLALPPLAEQYRIVERIESLFSKLDEAKEKAQAVIDSFESRRAAILHKAFSGELTEKWRRENGVEFDYHVLKFSEVAEIKSNLVDPAEYQDYPHIAPDNIEKKTGVLLDYHTIQEDGVKSGKHHFYPGQILYSKIRPNLSKVVVVDFEGLCSADMYPIEAKGDTKCLWYYMLSEKFLEQASSAGSRSVLPKINQKELSGLNMQMPSLLEEQKEISNILDDIFEKEYQAKQTTEAVLSQIDSMKKAVLSKAFCGELGTNDVGEKSAVELLKEIISGNTNEEKPKQKRTTIPKELAELIQTDLERKIIMLFLKSENGEVSAEDIMSVSSKKFDILNTIRNLEKRKLIQKNNNYYVLMR